MHRRSQPGVFDTTTRPIQIRLATLAASALLVLSLGSCGGGGGSGSYTIGGSVSGLAQGGQVLLTLNWVNNAILGSDFFVQNQVGNGPFSFSSQVPTGDYYCCRDHGTSGIHVYGRERLRNRYRKRGFGQRELFGVARSFDRGQRFRSDPGNATACADPRLGPSAGHQHQW